MTCFFHHLRLAGFGLLGETQGLFLGLGKRGFSSKIGPWEIPLDICTA